KDLVFKVFHASEFADDEQELFAAFGTDIKLPGNIGDARDHLFRGIEPADAGHGWVHAQQAAVRRAPKHADYGFVEYIAIPPFRFPQRFLLVQKTSGHVSDRTLDN